MGILVDRERINSGGAGPIAGFNYQAAVSAIAFIHMLRGTPVLWTKGYSSAPPIRVDCETKGPGDDIALALADEKTVEIQVKKGLRADNKFWATIKSLCEGLKSNSCDIGILVVCPSSSLTVRRDYSRAIIRLGSGSRNNMSQHQSKLIHYLRDNKFDPTRICSRLRILTVSALEDQNDAIAAAHSELGHICTEDTQIPLAWNVLYKEASMAIEFESSRCCTSLVSALSSSNIKVKNESNESPAMVIKILTEWIETSTSKFSVLGISDPLSIDRAWLNLQASIGNTAINKDTPIEDALETYHKHGSESGKKDDELIDAKTIGTFRRFCVVVGGPGSGKSLLTKVITREFIREGLVSLRVSLRALANRIENTGCTVEEGLLYLGLDGSGVSPNRFRSICISNVVYICDGLDECGHYQPVIAEALDNISRANPSYRIVVTTRPIGYITSELKNWRHYNLMPLKSEATNDNIKKILSGALDKHSNDCNELQTFFYPDTESNNRVVFNSPLLLAFAAALVLNRRTLGNSKVDLYTEIFKLIDNNLDPRRSGNTKISRALRYSVLNHLGWLVTTSPFTSFQEILSLCSKQIELESGKSKLESAAIAEESILYWETAGLIEQLHHGGQELLTFTHKSCGEFAGARFIETFDKAVARKLIESELDNTNWEEILDFATQTSVAVLVAEAIIDKCKNREPTPHVVNRVLYVIARHGNCIEFQKLTAFLDQLFELAKSEDRQKAYAIGLCLIKNDLSHLNEVFIRAQKLLKAKPEWSNLIGWAVLVCHFRDELDPIDLERAVTHYVIVGHDGRFFSQSIHDSTSGGLIDWILRDRPDQELLEQFLSIGLEFTLESLPSIKQTELILTVHKLKNQLSQNFSVQLRSLLLKIDRKDLIQELDFNLEFKGFNELCAANQLLLTKVLAGAFEDQGVSVSPITDMKHFGALLHLTHLMKDPADDAYVWTGIDDYTKVHYLLRAASFVFDLSLERLAAEVRYILRNACTERGFSEIPSVDPSEVNWEKASGLEINDDILEELVHHPSKWVAYLAANILNQRLTEDDRLKVSRRILGNGDGRTYLIAAHLACQLPNNEGHNLILARLGESLDPGSEYLFDRLAEDEIQVEDSNKTIVELGLISSSEVVAKSASRWCCKCMGKSKSWLLPLLGKAFDYWRINEPAYPKKGGIVPDSPREEIYNTLSSFSSFDFEDLVELSKDDRPEISRLAVRDLVNLASKSEVVRNQLVEEICDRRFSPSQCLKLFDANIPYTRKNLNKLSSLLNETDPDYRQVAVQILSHPNMEKPEALKLATRSKVDCDGNVRDAVYKFLGRLN